MSAHAFKVGESVTVRTLKKTGVVTEQLGSDLYVVAIGSLTCRVSHRDLESAPGNKPSSGVSSLKAQATRGSVSSSLDLHGLTVLEAVSRLEVWLNDAIVAGLQQVKVIHGLGSGRVQRGVHEALGRYPAVRAFRVNDANPGVTDVYIG